MSILLNPKFENLTHRRGQKQNLFEITKASDLFITDPLWKALDERMERSETLLVEDGDDDVAHDLLASTWSK